MSMRVPRLELIGLVCVASLIVSARWTVFAVRNDAMTLHGSVTAVPATGLIHKQANFFDLEGKTVTFTPNGATGYTVHIGELTWVETSAATGRSFDFSEPAERRLSPFDDRFRPRIRLNRGGEDTAISLPFAFPFAGRTWTRVHANTNGNVSFTAPETTHWQQRDPWADGTMRSVAAAVDSRAAAGLEAMIAALWAVYGSTTISVDSTPSRVTITWDAVRPTPDNAYYEPLGNNLFQARLYPSGVIEFAYRAVAERDGIVGLFHGLNDRGRTLDILDAAVGNVALGVLDITRIELVDNGSTVLATMTLAEDVPEQVADGAIDYRVFLSFGDRECAAGITVTADGRAPFTWCGPAPSVVGYRVHGATIEIPISKTLLNGNDHFAWAADAVWWGTDQFDYLSELRTVHVGEPDYDLATAGTVAGNVFEVFHYPSIPKGGREVMSFIYGRAPANAEIAVPFTDFRTDDLFSNGPGSGPINAPVRGIGPWQANPTPGERYGSDNLLVTMAPLFVGAPNFTETGVSRERPFRNFGYGIRWIAHEAVHRWASHLQFRSPRSGQVEDLTDEWCRCHWSNWLHAPAVDPVGPSYSSEPYSEASVMGGEVWVDNGDGTFTREVDGNPLPTGLSALDLYVMGMIPPSEVPETFILRDVQETDTWDTVTATKVPVRIEDIVAAMGPRVPAADASRKEFRLGVYLLHEDGRPPRMDLLERAQALTAAIPDYFAAATSDRMRVVPKQGPASNRPPLAEGTLAPLTLGVDEASVDVSAAFHDPDGDRLTYGATSSSPGVASVSVSGSVVTVTPVAAGTATVTVTARDSAGSSATQSIAVTVQAAGGVNGFTDDPIVPGVTPVRAVHFTELRARIDVLRQEAGLAPFRWTDAILTAGVTRVRLVHLLELREALAAAYAAAGRAAPRWTDAAAAAGTTPIRAAHLTELRAAVVALE